MKSGHTSLFTSTLFARAIVTGYTHIRSMLAPTPDGARPIWDFPLPPYEDHLWLSLHHNDPRRSMRTEVIYPGYVRQPLLSNADYFKITGCMQMVKLQEFPPNLNLYNVPVRWAGMWSGEELLFAIPLADNVLKTSDVIGVACKVEMK